MPAVAWPSADTEANARFRAWGASSHDADGGATFPVEQSPTKGGVPVMPCSRPPPRADPSCAFRQATLRPRLVPQAPRGRAKAAHAPHSRPPGISARTINGNEPADDAHNVGDSSGGVWCERSSVVAGRGDWPVQGSGSTSRGHEPGGGPGRPNHAGMGHVIDAGIPGRPGRCCSDVHSPKDDRPRLPTGRAIGSFRQRSHSAASARRPLVCPSLAT